jgi:ABC-type amino acid transport substrate-binding protein
MNRLFSTFFLLVLPIVLTGCNHMKPETLLSSLSRPEKLKVGIAIDAPPLAYKKDGAVTGLETKLAAGLAQSTGQTLELVELPRPELTQALLDKKIDIIMAGLSAAETQEQHLTATDPYLASGQVALVHLDAYKQLGNGTHNLTGIKVRLGVVTGTPGDLLIKGLNPLGKITRFASAPEGVQALIDNAIDAFIFDFPSNYYYAALYVDKGLTPGTSLMTREQLVWGVRPNDQGMLKAANAYLAAIQQSGELQNLLERSIPFYKNTAYSPKK